MQRKLAISFQQAKTKLTADSFFQDLQKMNSDTLTLILVWFIGVVTFFVLWAVLLKVVHRISERKSQAKEVDQEDANDEEISPKQKS